MTILENGRRQALPGFTLIELMIAIIILGILAGGALVMYTGFVSRARVTTTKSNLKTLKSFINFFYIEHGRYPARLQDLAERPQGDTGKNWKQYLEAVPKDSFGEGSDFIYKINPPGSKYPYELYSYGEGGPEAPTDEGRISAWDL